MENASEEDAEECHEDILAFAVLRLEMELISIQVGDFITGAPSGGWTPSMGLAETQALGSKLIDYSLGIDYAEGVVAPGDRHLCLIERRDSLIEDPDFEVLAANLAKLIQP